MSERRLDFEIHVGFSRKAMLLSDRLTMGSREPWKALAAREVVNGPVSMMRFDAHDVPGVLGLMVTKRVTDPIAAIAEVNRVARMYASESDVRIELEQVLMTVERGKTVAVPPVEWNPSAQDFADGILISETPPFEAHFSLKAQERGLLMKYSTKDLIDMAISADVPVHQAVRFSTEDQVILTTFFRTHDEMVRSTASLAVICERAVERLGGIHLKVVSERIIACVQPKFSQSRQR